MVTVFKPTLGHITVPAYALAQGVFLGVISMIFNAQYPGIVVQAVFLTFGTLGALLLAYMSGLIKATAVKKPKIEINENITPTNVSSLLDFK